LNERIGNLSLHTYSLNSVLCLQVYGFINMYILSTCWYPAVNSWCCAAATRQLTHTNAKREREIHTYIFSRSLLRCAFSLGDQLKFSHPRAEFFLPRRPQIVLFCFYLT